MSNMTLTDDEIKAVLRSLPNEISSTARLVAILEKLGITDTQLQAELAGVSDRMVRHARKQIAGVDGNRLPKPETDCRDGNRLPSSCAYACAYGIPFGDIFLRRNWNKNPPTPQGGPGEIRARDLGSGDAAEGRGARLQRRR